MKITELYENKVELNNDFGAPIYHGSHRLDAGIYHTQKLRVLPKSTYLPIHTLVGKLSEEKFGINVRSLMFCSMTKRNAASYGNVFEVRPIDNYRIFVADGIFDMTMLYDFVHQSYEDKILDIMREHMDRMSFNMKDAVEAFLNNLDYKSRNKENVHTMKEIYQKLEKVIVDVLKKEGLDEFLQSGAKAMLKSIQEVFERIDNRINDYIGRLKEVKHASEINDKTSELMVYFPDGFQAISVED